MKEDRISVFGRDAEGNEKRGFDCLLINGKPYIESINKEGHKIKTPASSDLSLNGRPAGTLRPSVNRKGSVRDYSLSFVLFLK